MTVAEAVRLVQLRIRPVAGEEELSQAKTLVGHVLGVEPAALMLHFGMELRDNQLYELGGYTERRAAGEPLQYIIGEWWFMGLPFLVEPGVLIPRADTEVLCENALALSRARGYRTVLDLCCGCGCIGVALNVLGDLTVTASDISREAVLLTQQNAARNGAQLEVYTSDLFDDIAGRYDMIVCNPPYLTHDEMDSLQTELKFEPAGALYGGWDGLDFYRRIAADYKSTLNRGGALLLEIGSGQADALRAMYPGARVIDDYAGNPRVVIVEES